MTTLLNCDLFAWGGSDGGDSGCEVGDNNDDDDDDCVDGARQFVVTIANFIQFFNRFKNIWQTIKLIKH